uniref:Small ribosomal subunit protein uS13 n=1 Tax=Fervidicoccus fontis TaxID=683846 RepID=A0A7J3ZLC3_9CREN
MSSEQFKYVVRIAGTDIDGRLNLVYGLASIKGVGVNSALAILRKLSIDPSKKAGYITSEELARIEDAIMNPKKYGLPPWLFNRRKDYETGEDLHLIGADLILKAKQDIEREKKIKSWRGIRHALGLKVRGQRTHTTGRLGATIGVSKKKK